MSEQIVLDLGEYGEVLVEDVAQQKKGVVSVSRGEKKERKRIDAGKLLRMPLTGLSKLFMASVPESGPDDAYAVDEFCVEFDLSIEAEAGSNLGAIVKIVPSGGMKCTYTWKRKKTEKQETAE
jgi:hypothetical protein